MMDLTTWLPYPGGDEPEATGRYSVRTRDGAEHHKCRFDPETGDFSNRTNTCIPAGQVSHYRYYSKLD